MPIEPISVLFVCMGNHCRSPAVLAVARRVAADQHLDHVVFDAAGITTHHRGELPHPLSTAEGARRGYSINHIGRPIHPDDFERFDLIVAMEMSNIDDLRRLRGFEDPRTGHYRQVEPEQFQLLRRWDPYAMPGDENLVDAWGKPAAAHAAMFDVIERCVPPMIEHLAWLTSETV
ncbi:MAG: low molecular weight phosphotyrosine protein phosphatase [Actinobacteria bacterium]|nr:low molecular weight phosphotyrosine protein phosphatase [Actinomycetota bacterium]